MISKCIHCGQRYRFEVVHNRECRKRKLFLKRQAKIETVEFIPHQVPVMQEVEIEIPKEIETQKELETPKRKYTKKVKI